MISINSPNFQNAFPRVLEELIDNGEDVVVRGQNTKELLSCHISVADTSQLCYFMPFRKDNIFARIAETLWVLQGRHDVGWLSYYLPRAPEFSDNGRTWRAAYGARLRHWEYEENDAIAEIDQIGEVLYKLLADPTTRQAVMTIWDPAIDNEPGLDIPCNNWLHFIRRRFGDTDYLFLDIAQRSADVFWGWSNINVFEWSILLKMMSFWTDSESGSIDWLVTSMHMYEHHYKIADKILTGEYLLAYNFKSVVNWDSPEFSTPYKDFDNTLERVFMQEHEYRHADKDKMPLLITTGDNLLDIFSHMLGIYVKFRQGSSDEFLSDMIAGMQESEFKYAALLHIARERPDILHTGFDDNDALRLVETIVSIESGK